MKYKIEEAGKTFIYHWFVYMIGALKQVDISSKIDVCFDREDYTSYQKETFDILSDVINVVTNEGDFNLIPSIKPTNIQNNSGQHHVDPDVYSFLRELFLSRVKKENVSDYERVYIRRNKSHLCEGNVEDNHAKRRQILNEDELVEDLQKCGFVAVNFEDYTVSQKIQIFNNAKCIASPQSGGLVFSLFAGKDTEIVEIYPPNPHQYCDQYIDICRCLGISFNRFTNVVKTDRYDNMVISSEEFVEYLTK